MVLNLLCTQTLATIWGFENGAAAQWLPYGPDRKLMGGWFQNKLESSLVWFWVSVKSTEAISEREKAISWKISQGSLQPRPHPSSLMKETVLTCPNCFVSWWMWVDMSYSWGKREWPGREAHWLNTWDLSTYLISMENSRVCCCLFLCLSFFFFFFSVTICHSPSQWAVMVTCSRTGKAWQGADSPGILYLLNCTSSSVW